MEKNKSIEVIIIEYINYLHSHSEYSNLRGFKDSTIKIEDAALHAFKMGATCSAITDHEFLGSYVRHREAVEKIRKRGQELYKENPSVENKRMANFLPIFGNEVYLSKEGQSAETWEAGDRFWHLILLAKNRKGWEQLNELSTLAWGRVFRRAVIRTPLYLSDLRKVVKQEPGNLICLSACIGNYLGEPILEFNRTKSEELKEKIFNYIHFMKDLFGDDFYLEIQPNNTSQEQIIYNSWLRTFAEATHTKLIITTDNHYLTKEDREIHKAYLNSDLTIGKEREVDAFYATTYFLSPEEIKEHLSSSLTPQEIIQAMKATHEVAAKCEYYEINSPLSVPSVETRIEGWEKNIHKKDHIAAFKQFSHSPYEIDRYFIYKIITKYEEKIEKKLLENSEKEINRIEKELSIIWKISERIGQRLSNYFNTMEEILEKIWEIAIIGAGRGSAGGSFLSFILDITQINPLTTPTELQEWRFLHESRPELPDLDIDSPSSKKDEIFQLLSNWFAEQNKTIAKVATFGTEKSKSALLTAARGLGYEPEEGLFLSSLVPIDRGFPRKLSICMYGDDTHKPVPEFVRAMREYLDVFKVAEKIEGLINSLSQHAAAIVVIENEELYSRTSLLCSLKGEKITAYNLEDLENQIGLVKYDMLQTDALDAIQTTLYLLVEHGYIEWEGSLKKTYNRYLHPSVINYEDKKMWDLFNSHQILSCFQWDSLQGRQGIDLAHPNNLQEMSAVNSALRLMANEYHPELPLITYAKQKENIKLWYNTMERYGLTAEEIATLEEYLTSNYGVCIEQELAMELAMDKRVASFDMTEANRLRRTIARKKIEEVEELKNFFYQKGKENGTRIQMLDYVWNEAFGLQMGYSFSKHHSTAYSVIAIQQMNLVRFYPSIFWATARLMVESGSIDFIAEDLDFLADEIEEEEITKSKSINYFKMSNALNKIRSFGVEIMPPNINKSNFTFSPNVEENTIYFGFMGITRISSSLIYDILENRPYNGLKDFLSRVKVNKIQATMLIKSGAFDEFGNREELLFQYCDLIADKKPTIDLRNMTRVVNLKLVPKELLQEEIIFKVNKFLRKNSRYGDILISTPGTKPYLDSMNLPFLQYDTDGTEYMELKDWEKFYKKAMNPVRNWMKREQSFLINAVNQAAIQELLEKYSKGNKAAQEMEALSYYYSYHELVTSEYKSWLEEELKIKNFFDLPEDPQIEWQGNNGAKKFRLSTIAGTSIGRDKTKNIVGFLTPEGFITVKIYKSTFVKYDKQIKLDNLTEKSWFVKGSKLLIQGYRNGENEFVAKTYKGMGQMIHQIVGPGVLKDKRIDEGKESFQ